MIYQDKSRRKGALDDGLKKYSIVLHSDHVPIFPPEYAIGTKLAKKTNRDCKKFCHWNNSFSIFSGPYDTIFWGHICHIPCICQKCYNQLEPTVREHRYHG